jgi:Holliday junction resolvase RusA-like endonuclease
MKADFVQFQIDYLLALVKETASKVSFNLALTGVSKERPRFNKTTGKAYTAAGTRAFEEKVRAFAANKFKSPMQGSLKCTIYVYDQMPNYMVNDPLLKAAALAKIIRPERGDLDNKVKAVTDALNGVAYYDDKQISEHDDKRFYTDASAYIAVSLELVGLTKVQVLEIKRQLQNDRNASSGPTVG